MPFIHISVTEKLSDDKKQQLADAVGRCAPLLPGKQFEKTMVRVDDGCLICRGGEPASCAFASTHVRRPNELSDKVAYVEQLYKVFEEQLGFEQAQCYFQILESDEWGSRGSLH